MQQNKITPFSKFNQLLKDLEQEVRSGKLATRLKGKLRMSIGTKKTPRLLAAAKEFNIGKDTLIEFLTKQGFDTVSLKPTSKITEDMYVALQGEFAQDKAAKKKSDALDLPKASELVTPSIANPEPEPAPAVQPEPQPVEENEIPGTTPKDEPIAPVVEEPEVNEPVVSETQKEQQILEPKVEKPSEPEPSAESEPEVTPIIEETPQKIEDKKQPVAKQEEKPEETPTPEAKVTEETKPETTAEAKSETPEPVEAVDKKEAGKTEQAEEKEIPVVEKVEAKEKVEKQPAEETEESEEAKHIETESPTLQGPKIVSKIDLSAINATTRPKKSAGKKKPEPRKDNKPTKPKEKKQTEETRRKETPVVAKKEAPIKTEKKPEPPKPNVPDIPEHIETKVVKLEGPKILGKIELPKTPDHSKDKHGKRKRKRIPVDKKQGKPGMGLTQRNNNNNNNNRRQSNKRGGGRRKPAEQQPREIDSKEIQSRIRQTQAKLEGGGSKHRSLKAKYRRNKREERAQRMAAEEDESGQKKIQVTEFISVSELANLLDISFAEVIEKCMNLGIMVSINQRLDAEIIELVASEFDTEVEFINLQDQEEEEEEEEDDEEDLEPRAPVITIMGHVDHGKTSLLDYIRSAHVATGEAGGITQHIGAYTVTMDSGKKITFLDTPGHEAFTAMRARGAKAADVAIIVIAADDAVMPQTREAISHAQAAQLPMVFALNKIDKDGANPEKIKEQLSTMNILVEDWGGAFQSQEISAKKGINIDELLEKVLLEAELLDLKANPNRNASGTVIEASLDKGRGYLATILVQNGTLHVGDNIVCGPYFGRVKAMSNERGKRVKEAGPSTPVQVLGLNGAPQAGEKMKVYDDESEAKSLANYRSRILREQGLRSRKHITLDEIGRRLALGTFKELNVIIKADVDGSAEALSDSLQKLSTDEIVVNIVLKGVGQISESDVMLASASDAIIIGFQVRPSAHAARIAEEENIEIRNYSIIYDAIEEIKSAMEGMLEPKVEKQVVGNLEVRETFHISKIGTIAGCYVTDGKISRNTMINVIRDGIVVHTGDLASLKRFKDDVKDVSAGYECGLTLKGFNDLKVGDILEGYEEVEVKRTL